MCRLWRSILIPSGMLWLQNEHLLGFISAVAMYLCVAQQHALCALTCAWVEVMPLEPCRYGSLAEIGAGQEVARWFFRVGGAAGTIAKSVSA